MEIETAKVYTVYPPASDRFPQVFVPERFKKAVLTHLLSNFLSNERVSTIQGPLILAISGQPGSGKSFMSKYLCNQLGVPVYYLSASSLSSKFEGFPVIRLTEAYAAAGKDDSGRSCILIDDIDTSIMSKSDDARYTVNSQILSGALMNLCDNPCPNASRKVPIIVTANNLGNLYQPLTRLGRMRIFNWAPDLTERKSMIRTLLAEFSFTDKELGQLAHLKTGRNGSNAPVSIAFFEQVKHRIFEQALWGSLDSSNPVNIDELLRQAHEQVTASFDKKQLLSTSRMLLAEHVPRNHLRKQ
jgi:SpoVK/Ycf46/Vps4 family AAA+-type ATPase